MNAHLHHCHDKQSPNLGAFLSKIVVDVDVSVQMISLCSG